MMQNARAKIDVCLCVVYLFTGLFFAGCRKPGVRQEALTVQDSAAIVGKILAHRARMNELFRDSPDSPFNTHPPIAFAGLKYFPPNLNCRFISALTKYPSADTVIILGTKGEPRNNLKFGYFTLQFEGKEYRLNVYKFTAEEGANYERLKNTLNVWFTDGTTGKETYHVGRYLDVGDENPDPGYVYVVDFNYAYNPYCCYNSSYTCAVPPREDHLPFRIEAGERTY